MSLQSDDYDDDEFPPIADEASLYDEDEDEDDEEETDGEEDDENCEDYNDEGLNSEGPVRLDQGTAVLADTQDRRNVSGPELAAAIRGLKEEANFLRVKDDKDKKTKNIPKPFNSVIHLLRTASADRVFQVGNALFAKPVNPGGDLFHIKGPQEFIGWLGDHHQIHITWKSMEGCITKAEAFPRVKDTAKRYLGIESAPHYLPIQDLFYNHPPLPAPDWGALRTLIGLFCPETEIDRVLIAAFFLTAVWGGPPGLRPAFVITSKDGRGVGKTTLAETAAELLGQRAIHGRTTGDMEKMKTRLLSPDALTNRVVIFDNETGRVASSDLAELITCRTISGHAMYAGEGQRPNFILWCITLNAPTLDSDLASRGIPISISKPPRNSEWRGRLDGLLAHKRWAIIAALIECLKGPGADSNSKSRWSVWESEVLSKATGLLGGNLQDVAKEVIDRQAEYDDEATEIDLIADAFRAHIDSSTAENRRNTPVFIRSNIAADIYREATGLTHKANNAACRELKGLAGKAIPQLSPAREGGTGQRGFLWTEENARDNQRPHPFKQETTGLDQVGLFFEVQG